MADHPDVLVLRVTNAPVGTHALTLRMSPELVDDVRAALDEAGIDHGEVLELSSGAQLALEMVQYLSGPATLSALAVLIRTVARRDDGKKVQLKGDSLDITGYSPEDADKLIDKYYKRQEENEAEWKRMKEEDDS